MASSDSEAPAQHRRNQAMLSVYAERDAAQAEVERLRAALEVAADDLGKAANQFAGMEANVRNADIFAAKEARARDALTSPAESDHAD